MRANPDGTELEIFARGVRSSVGMDFHPQTGQLWFTENGRDWLGDNLPPDELNIADQPFKHFGFPFCHGKSIADPEFGKEAPCSEFTPPAFEFAAHVAPLGIRFYTGTTFPERYRNGLFVAKHGSWNSSTPVGYNVSFVSADQSGALKEEVFADGWLSGGKPWGRPVDVLMLPDGSLLVSDDHAGQIYSIRYEKN
jgi:hypothetical protein